MAVYSVATKKSAREVLDRALDYFGEGGLGLAVTAEDACCVTFEGGGGHVSVTASQGQGEATARLETREWDYRVREFMRQI
ncbi:MAG: hypothetical protein PVF54_00395 [Anaerolineae bacterium]